MLGFVGITDSGVCAAPRTSGSIWLEKVQLSVHFYSLEMWSDEISKSIFLPIFPALCKSHFSPGVWNLTVLERIHVWLPTKPLRGEPECLMPHWADKHAPLCSPQREEAAPKAEWWSRAFRGIQAKDSVLILSPYFGSFFSRLHVYFLLRENAKWIYIEKKW